MEGNDEDEPTLNFAIRIFCLCLTCKAICRVSWRTMYWHMQEMVDLVARLGDTFDALPSSLIDSNLSLK
jgi:hypothetical protein